MYPETDVPPVEPEPGEVPTPELLTAKASRYEEELDLDPGLAEQVAYGQRWPEFERAIEFGVDPALAARTVESTVTELRRDDVPVEHLTERHFDGVFELVADGELTQEGVEELLQVLAASPDRDPAEAAESAGLGTAEEDAVRAVVQEVVERNADQVEAEGMGAFSGLMGECMAELRGNAEGEIVSDLLREEIQARA